MTVMTETEKRITSLCDKAGGLLYFKKPVSLDLSLLDFDFRKRGVYATIAFAIENTDKIGREYRVRVCDMGEGAISEDLIEDWLKIKDYSYINKSPEWYYLEFDDMFDDDKTKILEAIDDKDE